MTCVSKTYSTLSSSFIGSVLEANYALTGLQLLFSEMAFVSFRLFWTNSLKWCNCDTRYRTYYFLFNQVVCFSFFTFAYNTQICGEAFIKSVCIREMVIKRKSKQQNTPWVRIWELSLLATAGIFVLRSDFDAPINQQIESSLQTKIGR